MNVHTTAVRYGTDLGRQEPSCPARRHGTYSAYSDGCRCPHAREAHRIYQKRHREGRAELRHVDGSGTRRRIQALWAIGHTSQTISAATGGTYSRQHIQLIPYRPMVSTSTRDAIAAAYRELVGVPGTSVKTRARAVAAGYPTPARWGDDIDDPAAVPEPDDALLPELDFVDEVAVQRAIRGERLRLNDAERAAAVKAGLGRGLTLTATAELLGMSVASARSYADAGVSPSRAREQRTEAAVAELDGLPIRAVARRLGATRATVRKARRRLAAAGQIAS